MAGAVVPRLFLGSVCCLLASGNFVGCEGWLTFLLSMAALGLLGVL